MNYFKATLNLLNVFLANQLIDNSGKMKGVKLLHANKNNDKNIEILFLSGPILSQGKVTMDGGMDSELFDRHISQF